MEKLYSTFETCKILGIKRVTLKSWLTDGFIKPTLKTIEGRGPGERSLFNRNQLYLIRLFQVMTANNISRNEAKSLIQKWNDVEPDPKNDENWLTIFKTSKYLGKIEKGAAPIYAHTSTNPINLKDFRLIFKNFPVKYEIEDFDMINVFNLKKIRKSVDLDIGE